MKASFPKELLSGLYHLPAGKEAFSDFLSYLNLRLASRDKKINCCLILERFWTQRLVVRLSCPLEQLSNKSNYFVFLKWLNGYFLVDSVLHSSS